MIPRPPPGHDQTEYQRMADLLTMAVDTGWMPLELVIFFEHTLGYDRATTIRNLAQMIGQLRQLRGLPAGPLGEGEKPV